MRVFIIRVLLYMPLPSAVPGNWFALSKRARSAAVLSLPAAAVAAPSPAVAPKPAVAGCGGSSVMLNTPIKRATELGTPWQHAKHRE